MVNIPAKHRIAVGKEKDRDLRLRFFDRATERLGRASGPKARRARDRGWNREALYR